VAALVDSGQFGAVVADPQGFCDWIVRTVRVPGASLTVVSHSAVLVVIEVSFDPPTDPELADYPVERARISLFADGQVVAVPVGDPTRTWEHRYPTDISAVADGKWTFALGGLCLWFPGDPPHLRWDWSKGLDDFIRIVQRHLLFEEYCRRNRRPWPVEDAPHGAPPAGKTHPIVSPSLRRLA
jgi:hypothetical protein